jgi:NAD(P)-dependent dehydrogenase (short-subunit alcohol dehydrogenase family)
MSNIRMKKQNETPTEKIDNERKVAVVTGSSSGIGYATALQLARNGYLTFATMRNPEKGSDLIGAAKNEGLPIQVEQLNITDPDSINDFMTRINKTVGRIDVLVNNAGYWLIGALEDLSIREIQDQLDTNLLGTIRVTREVLPLMRERKSGTIVNVTSALGRFGLPAMSGYVASKFALEGLTESLAYEVAPFGIKVILIEPGVVKTKVKDNSVVGRRALRNDSPYSSMLGSFNAAFSILWENASTSDEVAATILHAISSPEPKLRYPVGSDVAVWLEKKSTMSDEQFQEYMMTSFGSLAPRQT